MSADNARAAIARRGQPDPAGTNLTDMIEAMRPELARALPAHLSADRMARIALTIVRQTPALARCSPQSFLGALMTSAQLGLEPGPLGHAYLVPYGSECTLIIGYRGYVDLAWRSGQVASITAEVVHENDRFVFARGLEPKLEHSWDLVAPRGAAVGAYASFRHVNGGSNFVVLARDEIDAVRKRARAGNGGPWVTDTEAMWRKTAVRQLARWLPMSAELARAVVVDGTVRTDLAPEAIDTLPPAAAEPDDAWPDPAPIPATEVAQ